MVVAVSNPRLASRGLLRICMLAAGFNLLSDMRKLRLLGLGAGMGVGTDCLARGSSTPGRQAAQHSLLRVCCCHPAGIPAAAACD